MHKNLQYNTCTIQYIQYNTIQYSTITLECHTIQYNNGNIASLSACNISLRGHTYRVGGYREALTKYKNMQYTGEGGIHIHPLLTTSEASYADVLPIHIHPNDGHIEYKFQCIRLRFATKARAKYNTTQYIQYIQIQYNKYKYTINTIQYNTIQYNK